MKLTPDSSWKDVMQTMSVVRQWAARRSMRLSSFFEVQEALESEGLTFDIKHATDALADSDADQASLDAQLGVRK